MPNYSLHNTVPERDRSLEDKGFHGITSDTHPPTSYCAEGLGPPPGQLTHPLVNQVNPSSNTSVLPIGEAAGDIVKRSR